MKTLKHIAYAAIGLIAAGLVTATGSPAAASYVENHGVSAAIWGVVATAIVGALVAIEAVAKKN